MTPSEIEQTLKLIAKLKERVYLSILEERWAQAKSKAKEAKRLEDLVLAAAQERAKFQPTN